MEHTGTCLLKSGLLQGMHDVPQKKSKTKPSLNKIDADGFKLFFNE